MSSLGRIDDIGCATLYARSRLNFGTQGYPCNRPRTVLTDRPRADVHYPRSVGEFHAWFSTDGDCLDYLEWLR